MGTRDRKPAACRRLTALTTPHTVSAAHQGAVSIEVCMGCFLD
jgi:hypothetical protein